MAVGADKPIDMAGIAVLLGVAATTPQQWRQRGVLPEPDPELSFPDKPLWRTSAIIEWAKATGRWPRGAAHERRPVAANEKRRRGLRKVDLLNELKRTRPHEIDSLARETREYLLIVHELDNAPTDEARAAAQTKLDALVHYRAILAERRAK